jgi:hypothetical protein
MRVCVFLFENVHLLSVELSTNECIAVVYALLSTLTAALRIVKVGEMLVLVNVFHTPNKKSNSVDEHFLQWNTETW